MKKFLVLILVMASTQIFSQTGLIVPINIVLPQNPDANTANWGSGTSILTISAATKLANGRIDSRVTESKILVVIKKEGSKICGVYTSNSAPAAGFNEVTKAWSGNNAISLLGKNCALPPGDYEICVQFFGKDAKGFSPLSEEKCKAFTINGKNHPANPQPKRD